jgi:pseudaminic acid synthase
MLIDTFSISKHSETFIVAELSANHNQKYELAVKTIEAIAKTGANAVKIQTYTPDTITIDSRNEYFKMAHGTIWDGKYLYELYQEAYTPWEWQPGLKKIAEDLGLVFFSSPFDRSAVDFLESMSVPAYKVASFEITDIPLIEYIASKGKPVIISTGIAYLDDIKDAIEACRKMNNQQIALLKCTSSYPAPFEEINLNVIPDLERKFNLPVGLSDHTLGNSVAVAAVALGAKIVEKHFILHKNLGGPDAAFSMEPAEFTLMVKSIREIEKAMGTADYKLTRNMEINRSFSRSLFVVKDISAGELFTKENLRSIRPGYGLPPKCINQIIGKRAVINIQKGTPLNWNLIRK